MPPLRASRLAAPLLALALLGSGCLPSPGPFVLGAIQGRVLDEDTGRPIAGAEVFEWHRGAGRGGSQPIYHARWTQSDEQGRFALPRACSPSPRMWLLRTYAPTYSFYHPDYGLERGPASVDPEALVLRGSRRRAEIRRGDLAPYCRGEHDDAGSRHLAAIACPERPDRPGR